MVFFRRGPWLFSDFFDNFSWRALAWHRYERLRAQTDIGAGVPSYILRVIRTFGVGVGIGADIGVGIIHYERDKNSQRQHQC